MTSFYESEKRAAVAALGSLLAAPSDKDRFLILDNLILFTAISSSAGICLWNAVAGGRRNRRDLNPFQVFSGLFGRLRRLFSEVEDQPSRELQILVFRLRPRKYVAANGKCETRLIS